MRDIIAKDGGVNMDIIGGSAIKGGTATTNGVDAFDIVTWDIIDF